MQVVDTSPGRARKIDEKSIRLDELVQEYQRCLPKVEEPLPAATRAGGPINNGAARASEKESKPRLTRVEESLPTQSREGGTTNHGAAHESGKESEPRLAKGVGDHRFAAHRQTRFQRRDDRHHSNPVDEDYELEL